MADQKFDINVVTTRVRQLILKYKAVQQDNDSLYAMIDERDKQIEDLKRQLAESKKSYDNLMAAKLLKVSDRDIEISKRRISKLLRSVNCCISLINEHGSKDI